MSDDEDHEASDSSQDPEEPAAKRARMQPSSGLYMDTVTRVVLDFDFEKLCAISLSRTNIYACLVCGKYLQGRGRQSHAYFHSMQAGHHVFMNLETLKTYILPDLYEVQDSCLDDIKVS
jgi:U4/U6.U5 tri-snRNP-associated protein 2